MSDNTENIEILHIGDLAKSVGKSVRAVHHYEELGLLEPNQRSKGGFREYDSNALAKIKWILKLQTIGFSLTEIKRLVDDFSTQENGPRATSFAHSVFNEKRQSVRATIKELAATEEELTKAIEYLAACQPCQKNHIPADCKNCGHHGHTPDEVPSLFSVLTDSLPGRDATTKSLEFLVKNKKETGKS